MASLIYNNYKKKLMEWWIDLDTDTIKVALVTSSYTPNQDTDEFFDDVSWESTWTWYIAWWATIANPTITLDTINDCSIFDWDDIAWSSSSISAAWAVVYKSTGTASSSPLLFYIDFSWTKTSTDWDFKIIWNASWILKIS